MSDPAPKRPRHPADPPADKAVETDPTTGVALRGVPRVISLIVLLAVVLLISVLFFRVMATFLVPLFLAAVLTVVFKPLHGWFLAKFKGRPHLSALCATVAIASLVIAPTVYFALKAFTETAAVVETLNQDGFAEAMGERVAAARDNLEAWVQERVSANFELPETQVLVYQAAEYARSKALAWGVGGFAALVGFAVGLAIMMFALYYFFADGPRIVATLMHLSPLDDQYERELLQRFTSVSRAVVLATILSAIVQGLLAGVGYYFVLDEGAPVFLLTVLTMLLAIVPFVGATAVWIPVALWVFFVQDDFWPGVLMALYGGGVVSTIDNFIKPYVLHGRSNLHPLLALLSVLGGLQLLGPIGILVGPMLVAFMQALLEMLRRELDVFRAESEAAAIADGDASPG